MTAQAHPALMELYSGKTFAPNVWLKDQDVSLSEMGDHLTVIG
jgi:hypothetical protein